MRRIGADSSQAGMLNGSKPIVRSSMAAATTELEGATGSGFDDVGCFAMSARGPLAGLEIALDAHVVALAVAAAAALREELPVNCRDELHTAAAELGLEHP
jgi:hypothetical protein